MMLLRTALHKQEAGQENALASVDGNWVYIRD